MSTDPNLHGLHREVSRLAGDLYGSRISYDALPPAMVASGFDDGLRGNIDLLFHTLATGSPPTELEMQPMVELALERIRDGADLSEILDAYHEVTRLLWDELVAGSDEERLRSITAMVPTITRHVAEVTTRITVAAGSLGETSAARSEARRAFAAALLAGEARPDLAAAARIAPAERYSALDLRLVPGAPPLAVRGLERMLAAHGALFVPDDRGWVALIPADRDEARAAVTQGLLEACGDDGAFFHAGVALAETAAGVPAAVTDARIVRAVRALGPPSPVPATPESERFALLTLRSEEDRKPLRALAAAVREHPDLEATLRAFVRSDGNQAATARILHVHRNTVPYRLSRLAGITGADPSTIEGAALLRAALLVSDVESEGAVPDGA
ncbi:CdaR family transcriptional regulator [Tsukamurella sp. 1534]|uniref:PucR family transcriptional regulator n=1 Tax=Tsukamurella sp. 1534 TaxID=1151061 RepID=UPI00031A0602|nr:PucR family transcriptional regulator [Tsukamurella sp. 1534]